MRPEGRRLRQHRDVDYLVRRPIELKDVYIHRMRYVAHLHLAVGDPAQRRVAGYSRPLWRQPCRCDRVGSRPRVVIVHHPQHIRSRTRQSHLQRRQRAVASAIRVRDLVAGAIVQGHMRPEGRRLRQHRDVHHLTRCPVEPNYVHVGPLGQVTCPSLSIRYPADIEIVRVQRLRRRQPYGREQIRTGPSSVVL